MKPEIFCMDLSVRAVRVLAHEGILSLSQIDAMTDRELLRLPGLGRLTLLEIRAAAKVFAQDEGSFCQGICTGYCERHKAECEVEWCKGAEKEAEWRRQEQERIATERERLGRLEEESRRKQERLEEESRRPISVVYVQGK
jgi:hypothetical protein